MAIETLLHSFRLGDVEDPQIYAAEPLWQWQQSEAGQWCMENCIQTPEWHTRLDHSNYGYRVDIVGKLSEQNFTYFRLKYSPVDC
jgi:hypothetical protein